jgi:hypothetical protein
VSKLLFRLDQGVLCLCTVVWHVDKYPWRGLEVGVKLPCVVCELQEWLQTMAELEEATLVA